MFNQYLKHSRTTILFVMMLGAFIIMSIFLPGKFLTLSNFQSIASQIPEFGLLAIAIMLAMLTGGIDLSIISTANLAGVGAALMLTKYSLPQFGSYESLYLFFSNSLSYRHILALRFNQWTAHCLHQSTGNTCHLRYHEYFFWNCHRYNQRIWHSGIPGKFLFIEVVRSLPFPCRWLFLFFAFY